jgi:hypothetical protein
VRILRAGSKDPAGAEPSVASIEMDCGDYSASNPTERTTDKAPVASDAWKSRR